MNELVNFLKSAEDYLNRKAALLSRKLAASIGSLEYNLSTLLPEERLAVLRHLSYKFPELAGGFRVLLEKQANCRPRFEAKIPEKALLKFEKLASEISDITMECHRFGDVNPQLMLDWKGIYKIFNTTPVLSIPETIETNKTQPESENFFQKEASQKGLALKTLEAYLDPILVKAKLVHLIKSDEILSQIYETDREGVLRKAYNLVVSNPALLDSPALLIALLRKAAAHGGSLESQELVSITRGWSETSPTGTITKLLKKITTEQPSDAEGKVEKAEKAAQVPPTIPVAPLPYHPGKKKDTPASTDVRELPGKTEETHKSKDIDKLLKELSQKKERDVLSEWGVWKEIFDQYYHPAEAAEVLGGEWSGAARLMFPWYGSSRMAHKSVRSGLRLVPVSLQLPDALAAISKGKEGDYSTVIPKMLGERKVKIPTGRYGHIHPYLDPRRPTHLPFVGGLAQQLEGQLKNIQGVKNKDERISLATDWVAVYLTDLYKKMDQLPTGSESPLGEIELIVQSSFGNNIIPTEKTREIAIKSILAAIVPPEQVDSIFGDLLQTYGSINNPNLEKAVNDHFLSLFNYSVTNPLANSIANWFFNLGALLGIMSLGLAGISATAVQAWESGLVGLPRHIVPIREARNFIRQVGMKIFSGSARKGLLDAANLVAFQVRSMMHLGTGLFGVERLLSDLERIVSKQGKVDYWPQYIDYVENLLSRRGMLSSSVPKKKKIISATLGTRSFVPSAFWADVELLTRPLSYVLPQFQRFYRLHSALNPDREVIIKERQGEQETERSFRLTMAAYLDYVTDPDARVGGLMLRRKGPVGEELVAPGLYSDSFEISGSRADRIRGRLDNLLNNSNHKAGLKQYYPKVIEELEKVHKALDTSKGRQIGDYYVLDANLVKDTHPLMWLSAAKPVETLNELRGQDINIPRVSPITGQKSEAPDYTYTVQIRPKPHAFGIRAGRAALGTALVLTAAGLATNYIMNK